MRQRGDEERTRPWTLAEGVRDALRILAWRALVAMAAWALLLLGLRSYFGMLAGLGDAEAAVREVTRWHGGIGRRFNVGVAGAIVISLGIGWLLARDLVERVRFTGWVLRSLVIGTAVVSILGTTLLLAPTMPAAATGYVAVLAAIGVAAACVTIAMVTWGE